MLTAKVNLSFLLIYIDVTADKVSNFCPIVSSSFNMLCHWETKLILCSLSLDSLTHYNKYT